MYIYRYVCKFTFPTPICTNKNASESRWASRTLCLTVLHIIKCLHHSRRQHQIDHVMWQMWQANRSQGLDSDPLFFPQMPAASRASEASNNIEREANRSKVFPPVSEASSTNHCCDRVATQLLQLPRVWWTATGGWSFCSCGFHEAVILCWTSSLSLALLKHMWRDKWLKAAMLLYIMQA